MVISDSYSIIFVYVLYRPVHLIFRRMQPFCDCTRMLLHPLSASDMPPFRDDLQMSSLIEAKFWQFLHMWVVTEAYIVGRTHPYVLWAW